MVKVTNIFTQQDSNNTCFCVCQSIYTMCPLRINTSNFRKFMKHLQFYYRNGEIKQQHLVRNNKTICECCIGEQVRARNKTVIQVSYCADNNSIKKYKSYLFIAVMSLCAIAKRICTKHETKTIVRTYAVPEIVTVMLFKKKHTLKLMTEHCTELTPTPVVHMMI